MGKGSMTPPASLSSAGWKLKAPHDAQAQGIVVSGFSDLYWAEALFLEADQPGSGWIAALRTVAPITDATAKQVRSAVLAFTCPGLAKLGLDEHDLGTFATPFREGMYQEDRLRRLGDKIDGKWEPTVIPGGPVWGGNNNAQTSGPFKTVHALLLLYDKTEAGVQNWADQLAKTLAPFGVNIVHKLSLNLQPGENKIAREHFGFADGMSQPIPYGDSVVVSNNPSSNNRPSERNPWHGVPLGEILLGHANAHHEKAPGPYVRSKTNRVADLTREGAPEGFLNLGLNGSYMIVRELRQDVAAFWNSLKANAERIQHHDPSATPVTADWIAERIIGRTRDGHLLCPAGAVPPAPDGQPENDVGFLQKDPYGHGCPLGSHVRRSNPRDGLAPDLAAAQTILDAANNHRILRRGRKFGLPASDPYHDDGQERGLLFICLNSDIARQFEFIQQTWVLNQNFATLFDETDPLVGPKGRFTIHEEGKPLRRIVEVETFIRMAGGEYFFLPSIPALDYLASL
nr:hypothetical protein [uncultured Dongia sp.]